MLFSKPTGILPKWSPKTPWGKPAVSNHIYRTHGAMKPLERWREQWRMGLQYEAIGKWWIIENWRWMEMESGFGSNQRFAWWLPTCWCNNKHQLVVPCYDFLPIDVTVIHSMQSGTKSERTTTHSCSCCLNWTKHGIPDDGCLWSGVPGGLRELEAWVNQIWQNFCLSEFDFSGLLNDEHIMLHSCESKTAPKKYCRFFFEHLLVSMSISFSMLMICSHDACHLYSCDLR